MAGRSDEPKDENAALRARVERFGAGYAVMSEAMTGKGLDRVVGVVKLLIAACAAFVVVAAIRASL